MVLLGCLSLAGVVAWVFAWVFAWPVAGPDAGAHRREGPAAEAVVRHPAPGGPRARRAVETRVLRVLREWDRRRAGAYAAGSPQRLRVLYVPGSAPGVADVRVLRAYRERSLRVVGMRMQLLAVAVLEARADRLRLRVTDRLAAAVAVGAGRRTPLPRDQATTRVLTLLRDADGRWQVSDVRTPA